MAKGIWGIDVSRFSVKAVRLEESKEGVRLTDVDVIPYKATGRLEEADLEGRIVEALKDLKFSRKIGGERVALSLPTHSSFNRLVKLPPVEDVVKAVHYEAQAQIPFSLDQVVWGYQMVERQYQPGEEKEVILVALKREIIDNFLKSIEEVGLNVEHIQLSPIALYNFLVADQDVSQPMIVLEMGADNSSLIVIEGERFWVRNIPISGNDVTKAIMEAFSLPHEKAEALKVNALQSPHVEKIYQTIVPVYKNIVSEIHRSLGYYKSMSKNAKFDRIMLLGNGTKALNFQRFMGQALQIQPVRIQKLNTVGLAGSVDPRVLNANLQSMGAALGLALQGLGRTRNRVNLLPAEFLKKKQVKKKYPVVAAAAAILYVVLFFAMSRMDAKIKSLEAVKRSLEQAQAAAMEVSEAHKAKSNVGELKAAYDLLGSIANDRTPIRNAMELLFANFPDNSDPKIPDHLKLWLLDLRAELKEDMGAGAGGGAPRLVVSPKRWFQIAMDVAITVYPIPKVTATHGSGAARGADEARDVVNKQLFPGGFEAFQKRLASYNLRVRDNVVVSPTDKLEDLRKEDDGGMRGPGIGHGTERFWRVVITFGIEPIPPSENPVSDGQKVDGNPPDARKER
jgi:type IV pilus assembly protein PilM